MGRATSADWFLGAFSSCFELISLMAGEKRRRTDAQWENLDETARVFKKNVELLKKIFLKKIFRFLF